MKKLALVLAAAVLACLAFAGPAGAAPKTAVAGVAEVKGKPNLVIVGSNRMESFQIIKYSSVPAGGDWDDPEVPVWGISTLYGEINVAPDSLPGVCWRQGRDSVYCRRDKPKIQGVIASLGGGDDSFLSAKGLRVTVNGGPGADSIYGGVKNDVLIGGAGRDYLQAEGGNDVVSGGAGNDDLIGDKWRDGVFSRPYAKPAGRDRIEGGTGSDTIQGGAGPDLMIGGVGNDAFENRDRFRDRILGGAGKDSVHDPDISRTGNGVAILDRLSGADFLYLGFRKYRLR